MAILQRIPSWVRNKYFLSFAAFVLWMLFFDRNDLFTQMERKKELREISRSKDFFSQRIAEDRKFSKDLQFNASAIEKYAREKYLMKRDNEEIFLIKPLENK
ncbi:MAG: FtsB family cell division protein [Flavisolibacter sp.]|jgi:cell division protein DivIC